jgi:hypothetical protein
MSRNSRAFVTAASLAAALSMLPAQAASTPMDGTTKPTGSSVSNSTGANVNHGSGAATDNVMGQTNRANTATTADANTSSSAITTAEPEAKKPGFFSRLFGRDKGTSPAANPATGTTGPNDSGGSSSGGGAGSGSASGSGSGSGGAGSQ